MADDSPPLPPIDSIAWTLDDDSVKVLRVLALRYQPEAAGHWHL